MQAILPTILLLLCILTVHNVSADLRYRGNAVHPGLRVADEKRDYKFETLELVISNRPNYPGQCYYEELRQPIPKNQYYKPINRDGRCESIYCRKDYVIEIEYCGRHNLQPNETCRIESDMRRAYPACCPRLVCQTDNNFI